MTASPAVLLCGMIALTSAGAVAFRQYTATEAVGWLVLGFAAYNASNFAWIMLIDQAGLGRATVFAAACQIILLTGVSAVLGDAVGGFGWLAAGLACLAVLAASLHGDATKAAVQPKHAPSTATSFTSSPVSRGGFGPRQSPQGGRHS